VANTFS
jgi:hypothetical protein